MQARNKNATLSSFAVLISYLLAYLQFFVFKLKRDYVFGRNSCLGYPCILPHVLLSVSTFSVVVIDFSGPCLIRSRNSFSSRCLVEQVGAAVSQPHLYYQIYLYTITILSPSVPSSLPLAVQSHVLLQVSHSVWVTGSASPISKSRCLSASTDAREGKQFVQLRPKKVEL